MVYGTLDLMPLMFQDDFQHGSGSVLEARINNVRVDVGVNEKRLTLNSDKTVCIVMGTPAQREVVSRELEVKPLLCGEFETRLVGCDKWLGDYIHTKGLSESCLETIRQREGKIKGAALEGTSGGGFPVWTTPLGGLLCPLPSPQLRHLGGAVCGGVKRLEALQLWFLRLLLRVKPGVPSASLLWETSLLSMELRVWREKLCMILHFRGLEEDAVARRVMKDQQLFGWPGLVRETADISHKLGVDNPFTTDMTKKEYRHEVTRACHSLNEKQLRDKMTRDGEVMRKCELISQDEYGRKEYFEKTVPHLVLPTFPPE